MGVGARPNPALGPTAARVLRLLPSPFPLGDAAAAQRER